MRKNHFFWYNYRIILTYTIATSLFLFGLNCSKKTEKKELKKIKPPVAEKIIKELTIHDHTRIDNYYWLQERENPKVMEYLKAENEYKAAVMKHTEDFQKKLYDEIVGRIKQEDQSVPFKKNGYYYYKRYKTGKEYPVHCRKKESLEGKEEILLNVNELAQGYTFYHVTGLTVSANNKMLAYGVDTVSRRKYTIHFKNLETGETLGDKIPNTTGRAAWANDNKTVFYSLKDEALRPHRILKHRLGDSGEPDKEVYLEKDKTFSVNVYKSRSEKFLIITSFQTLSSEFRFLDANQPDGEFSLIQPREKNHEYSVEHFKDKFYIRTNWKAKNFRLMETPINQTMKENWIEVIPHREKILFDQFEIFKDHLVVMERKDGLIHLKIINWEEKSEHYINFGEETYFAYIAYNPEMETPFLRYGYSSLTTPDSTFDYDMNIRKKNLLKQEKVVGDFSPSDYHTERHYALARDGTRIPISLVYRKDLKKIGENPLLLYGYGSYGYSTDPYFNSPRLSLLERGFVYAIAHIRGGQEMGRYWYEEGKLLKKKNTFTDFIDCANYLIEKKFTHPNKLFAMGGSAGGLLMGAVTNMKPGLFKGVIAKVPWMDVVTCMLDDSVPLTTSEYDEWGDPRNKEYYDYMLSYSPYDNIEAKDYPSMLVTTGFHDSQVQFWDPAKYTAKLRAKKNDDNILLLDTNLEVGHGGASGRFQRHKQTALIYTFILDQLGIKK